MDHDPTSTTSTTADKVAAEPTPALNRAFDRTTVIRIDGGPAAGGRKISTITRKISCNVQGRKISFVMGPPPHPNQLSTSPRARLRSGNEADTTEDEITESTTVLNILDADDPINGGDDDYQKSVEYSVDALGDYSPQIRQQGSVVKLRESRTGRKQTVAKLSLTNADDDSPYFPYKVTGPGVSALATESHSAQNRLPHKTEPLNTLSSNLVSEATQLEGQPSAADAQQLQGIRRRTSQDFNERRQHKTSKVLFKTTNAPVANDNAMLEPKTKNAESEKLWPPRDSSITATIVEDAEPFAAQSTRAARNNASRVRSISYAFQYGTDWQITADEDDQAEEERKSSFFSRVRHVLFSPTVTRPYPSETKNQRVSLRAKIDRACRSFGAAVGREEWLFLLILGIIMACLSYIADMVSDNVLTTRLKLYDTAASIPLKLFIWLSFPLTLVWLATLLTNKCAPQAIGSGIPEMKTILSGVILKDYLSIPTLLTKYFGLMLMLSSGLPIGKCGPFVHIGSMVARQLNRLRAYLISRRLPPEDRSARRRGTVIEQQTPDDSNSGVYQTSRSMLVETAGKYETLAAGCATGVAAVMAAPIGGVLFSIEATSVYFAVKNYWRGFFAAVVTALTFLLLGVLMKKQVTILPVIQTKFPIDFPFDPAELLTFALVGVVCGVTGAVFVKLHRRVVMTQRKYVSPKMVPYFVYAYPLCFVTLYFLITFPEGIGHYMAGRLSPRKAVVAFFSDSDMKEYIETPQQKLQDSLQQNITAARQQLIQQLGSAMNATSAAYTPNQTTATPSSIYVVPYIYGGGGDETGFLLSPALSAAAHYGFEDNERLDDIRHFVKDRAPEVSVILVIANYVIFNYFATSISISLPVPAGVFVPTFVLGCSIGRLMGEIIAYYFPNGIADPDIAGGIRPILPGAYAVVGAAAFSGAVTQTISTSVIATEMTGQMAHILPVLVATLIANYVARRVGELSIFDSIIRLKRLPYLPQLDVLSESVHRLKAGDIMMRAVKFVTLCDTCGDVRQVLSEAPPSVRVLPLVDSPDTMVLVGAIARRDLEECVEQQLNFRRYLELLDEMQTRRPTVPAVFGKMLLEKQESEHKKIFTDDVDEEFLVPAAKKPGIRRRPKALSVGKLSLTKRIAPLQVQPGSQQMQLPTIMVNQEDHSMRATKSEERINRVFTVGSLSSHSTSSSSQSPSTADEDEEAEPTQLLLPSSSNGKAAVIVPNSRFEVSRAYDPPSSSPAPPSLAQIQQIWLPPVNEKSVDGVESPANRVENSSTSESPKSTTVNLLREQKPVDKDEAGFVAEALKDKPFRSNPQLSGTKVGGSDEPSAKIKEHVISRVDWEQQMLEQPCNFGYCSVDVSPMQVVENMSVSKLHRLFSLLGLQTVYATSLGRLVGVITVGDLRRALQEASKKP